MTDLDTPMRAEPIVADSAPHATPVGVVPGLIWAFRIHQDGAATPLAVGQPIEQPQQGWLWLHLDLVNVLATRWLATAGLPEPAVAMMLSHDRQQQLHVAGNFIYGIFTDLLLDINGTGDEVGYLHLLMTERLLVTGRRHALSAVESAKSAIETGTARLTHCASLLELIVEHMIDGVDGIADDLAAKLDGIEDQLALRSIGPARKNLAGVRRANVRLSRRLSELRAVLNRVARKDLQTLDLRLQLRASRLAQRLDELNHVILEIRERGYRLQDEVSTTVTEETNHHLHTLSVLTAVLLPPTLVAGIFGMNIDGLPLTKDNGTWAMAIMLASSILAYVVLRLTGVLKSGD
jgi:zinc transporter